LFIVLFVGWRMGINNIFAEISNDGILKVRLKWVYLFIIRFIAPIAIALVFLNGLGLFGMFGGGDL
ncbi:MAG: hypothetical protein Q7V19_04425, partial [Bacteroidales bacterium]|nr:hypothetical protein [Bacteroidales bacterium]